MIPLKNPICGVASIFQSLRRTPSTSHFWKISRLAPACRQAGLGLFERNHISRLLAVQSMIRL